MDFPMRSLLRDDTGDKYQIHVICNSNEFGNLESNMKLKTTSYKLPLSFRWNYETSQRKTTGPTKNKPKMCIENTKFNGNSNRPDVCCYSYLIPDEIIISFNWKSDLYVFTLETQSTNKESACIEFTVSGRIFYVNLTINKSTSEIGEIGVRSNDCDGSPVESLPLFIKLGNIKIHYQNLSTVNITK